MCDRSMPIGTKTKSEVGHSNQTPRSPRCVLLRVVEHPAFDELAEVVEVGVVELLEVLTVEILFVPHGAFGP